MICREGTQSNSIQQDCYNRLTAKFKQYALFFWDDISGMIRVKFLILYLFIYLFLIAADRIGIIWKPQAFMPKRFSVLETRLRLVASSEMESENGKSSTTFVNSVELIALIASELEGLLEKVEYL